MRMILAASSLALLAACGGGASNNAAGNAAAPAGTANAAAPAPSADPALAARRADEIRECSDDVRSELPEGADLNAFCGCAVDRMTQSGAGERDAMEQCAAQLGITPRGR